MDQRKEQASSWDMDGYDGRLGDDFSVDLPLFTAAHSE
jgi:hypothetical protein